MTPKACGILSIYSIYEHQELDIETGIALQNCIICLLKQQILFA